MHMNLGPSTRREVEAVCRRAEELALAQELGLPTQRLPKR